jgi:hypothetical protein
MATDAKITTAAYSWKFSLSSKETVYQTKMKDD